MKKAILGVMLLAAAAPAQAMNITNLDTITHKVEIDSRGEKRVITLAPNTNEYVASQIGGTLSIVTPDPKVKKKKAKGTLQSDGLLSGYIGNGRNVGVPIDNDYTYVIWPEGKLSVQSRSRSRRNF